MSRLNELIQEYCPDGVEYRKLNEICKFQNGFSFKSRLFSESGLPILRITNISNGKLSDDEYVYFNPNDYKEDLNNYIVKPNNIVVAMSGATTGKIGYNYSGQEYYLNQRVGMFLPNESFVLNRYLYHWLLWQSGNILAISSGTGAQPNLSSVKLMRFEIPVPPLPVQQEIVRILDSFTTLTAELEARKKQYEWYRDELLMFGDDVERKKLGEVAEIGTGFRNTQDAVKNGKYNFFVRSQTPLRLNEYDYDDESVVTAGDGVGVGKVFHITHGKYALHQRAYRIHPLDKSVLNVKYLYYVFANNFYDYIMMQKYNGSVASVRLPMLKAFDIPVPPLQEQQHIVSILDRFDALCNDISSGLPAEIEARKKQYEYYRDKLLTFKRLDGDE